MPRANYRQTHPTPASSTPLRAWLADRPQIPYLAPFFIFVLLMAPASLGTFAGIPFDKLWRQFHPFIYAAQSLAAAGLLWYFWPAYNRIRWTHMVLGAVVGLIGTPIWILIHYACLHSGWWPIPNPDTFYNPDLLLSTTGQRWAYLCIRIIGPTLVVPIMEELFFRDFLMRALVSGSRFEEIPIGTFTWTSFLGTAALFGINHGAMWPAGVVYGLMMGGLLVRTKSLGACITAHAVTNWTLYLYVIYTGDWQFM